MSTVECQQMARWFLEDVDAGFWVLIPVSEAILRRVSLVVGPAPANLFVRAGDALHLVTAQDLGEQEVWTNDRHLLAAAPYFGLAGRSV